MNIPDQFNLDGNLIKGIRRVRKNGMIKFSNCYYQNNELLKYLGKDILILDNCDPDHQRVTCENIISNHSTQFICYAIKIK